MIVAFGTSIPTSITVVATSTWTVPSRKRRITASRSSGLEPAVHQPDLEVRATGSLSCSAIVVAARRSAFSDSSITGSTTYACRPRRHSSPHELAAPAPAARRPRSAVRTVPRPGGRSRSVDTSRSP